MTDDELIDKAVAAIHRLESRRAEDDPMRALRVDLLPQRRLDGATIHFESDNSSEYIEVVVERDSGEIISATFCLPPHETTHAV